MKKKLSTQRRICKPISIAYFNKKKKKYFVKRFVLGLLKGNQSFINDPKNDTVEIVSTDWKPVIEVGRVIIGAGKPGERELYGLHPQWEQEILFFTAV